MAQKIATSAGTAPWSGAQCPLTSSLRSLPERGVSRGTDAAKPLLHVGVGVLAKQLSGEYRRNIEHDPQHPNYRGHAW